jgi:RNA polymerase sigma-70 factor (ECF subfamily)
MKLRTITSKLFRKKYTERDIVKGICNNDEKALRSFYDEYFQPVYNFVFYRVSGDKQSVEEIVTDVFMAAIRGAGRFSFKSSLFTWLCSIAKNKISDYYRKEIVRDRLEVAFSEVDFNIKELLESLESGIELPDEHVERLEVREIVKGVLASLPVQYQKVLELRYTKELKIREIGEHLGASIKAAESLLARAQKAFYKTFVMVSRNMMPGDGLLPG